MRRFFELIGRHQAASAAAMLSPGAAQGPADRALWKKNFESVKSMRISSLSPWSQNEWTPAEQRFKVGLQVATNPDDPKNPPPMPHYGWEDGSNTRWVTVKWVKDQWSIAQIATGP